MSVWGVGGDIVGAQFEDFVFHRLRAAFGKLGLALALIAIGIEMRRGADMLHLWQGQIENIMHERQAGHARCGNGRPVIGFVAADDRLLVGVFRIRQFPERFHIASTFSLGPDILKSSA